MRALACVALALLAGACVAEDGREPQAGGWFALHVRTADAQEEYFAQLSAADVAALRDGGGGPFVHAQRVCSLDDDGHLQEYADDDRGGDVWFRAEDVRRIVPLKRDPHVPDRDKDKDEDTDAKKPAEAPGPTLPKF